MSLTTWLRQWRINWLKRKIARHEAHAEFLARVRPLREPWEIGEHVAIAAEMREEVRQLLERQG